mmetsp:Transcript_1848/g.3360  ORF Transcript_1848/g.3360 Transcript_1848/m.3360 type:complete len:85 (+) Transcript_1848:430-684(+)
MLRIVSAESVSLIQRLNRPAASFLTQRGTPASKGLVKVEMIQERGTIATALEIQFARWNWENSLWAKRIPPTQMRPSHAERRME